MTSETPEQPKSGGSEPAIPDHGPAPGGDDALWSQHLDVDALTAYLDQQLRPADLAAARAHLATCPECDQELAELRATVALVQGLPQFAPRRDFQLGPEHAQRSGAGRMPAVRQRRRQLPGIDGWFDRLLPAVPALRIATVAVALLLVAVIAADVIVNHEPGNVAMLPASSSRGVTTAPEAAPPRPAPAAQEEAESAGLAQPTPATADDAGAFAEPVGGNGTDAAAPASRDADGAAGDAPGAAAPAPAASPAASGWRLVQVGLGLALVWLIVSLVGIARIRRDRFSAPAGEPDREPRS